MPGAAATNAPPAGVDPAVGPNAQQERIFASSASRLTADPALAAPAAHPRGVTRAAVSAQAAPHVASGNGILNREVFGFAPYWALPQWTEWQLNLLSTVAYFGVDLNGDGSVNQAPDNSGWSGWNSSNLTNLVNAAHQHGDRVLLTIKAFDNGTIDAIDGNPANAQHAIDTSIALVQQRGLDGVTVDFEGSTDSSAPNRQAQFTAFVTSLANQMHQKVQGSEVVVATYTGAASWDAGFMNITELGKVVDAMFIMAYDMAPGNTSGHASANAPLNGWTYNDTLAVQQYTAKAPASKVILGVPYYGYKWCTNSTAPNAAITSCPGNPSTVDTYSSMFDDFSCSCIQNLQYHWDGTASSPWASWWSPQYNSNRELYYDDTSSIGAKYDMVNSYGIRGAGIWALGYDTGHTELWSVISDKFGPNAGYWMGATDGGVFSFGRAHFHGSTGNMALNQPVVGMASTPSGQGYWLVASDGGIFSFGDAAFYGSTGNIRLNRPIVGMASTPSGHGYWLVASDGGIFSFGDAVFRGSTGNIRLNQPVVGMAPTPSGNGYWMVATDGGIFSFGDAVFRGSTGNIRLNQPVVGMAATPSGNGYWLVATDGGIFSFGDAVFHGSTGNIRLNKPVVGMAASPSGNGYWMVASDGGLFNFGDALFLGSMGGQRLARPVVGIAAPHFLGP
ncbi:MAG TPA: glycosyl hydrolase family 18 protein [Candidatus Dormibacteraeota bacterium]|nr:glycosyl hydrolase family 18 protein [Candidatus Dormibacteraeota bacterium]